MADVTLRQTSYDASDDFSNKNAELTHAETDSNWIALYQLIHKYIPVGVVQMWLGSTAPVGWLLCNGSSIGSAASTATLKSANYESLFKTLWDMCVASPTTPLSAYDDLGAAINFASSPVSAATAWSGNYTISLPDMSGRVPVGYNSGGSYSDTMMKTGGASTQDMSHGHTNNLTTASSGIHSHNVSITSGASGAHSHTLSALSLAVAGGHSHTITDPTHSHNVVTDPVNVTSDGATQVVAYPAGGSFTSTSNATGITTNATPDHTHSLSSGSTSTSSDHTHSVTGTTASSSGHTHTIDGGIDDATLEANLIQPYFTLNYIIKYAYAT